MSCSKRRLVATYPYRDAAGHVVYQLQRYHPKDFQWVTATGRAWGKGRRRALLYRLPELLVADKNQPVYVVEGEKDVDRLRSLGLVATCNDNGGGRGKWRRPHSLPLSGRSVIIIPDNDATGDKHAYDVASHLCPFVDSVRIVKLPGVPPKGDVSDWLDAGGNLEKLAVLSAAAPTWTPQPPELRVSREFDDLYDVAARLEGIIPMQLPAVEKLLLIVLAVSHGITPQQTMAMHLGVTQRRVRQLVADLQRRGILRVFRYGRSNRYVISPQSAPGNEW